jgi:hypothetical protein
MWCKYFWELVYYQGGSCVVSIGRSRYKMAGWWELGGSKGWGEGAGPYVNLPGLLGLYKDKAADGCKRKAQLHKGCQMLRS